MGLEVPLRRYVGDVGSRVGLQLPLTLSQKELNRTKVFLIQLEMLLELPPSERFKVAASMGRFDSSSAKAMAIELQDIFL